jgi:hypothetical protein
LDLTISLADFEGWNPGIHDAETFYITDPKGFYVGIFEGRPVASISSLACGDLFGFLGFYMVQPPFRGGGFGIEVEKAGLEHLQDRNIGLDSVLEQQELYKHMGFRPCYESVRCQGIGSGFVSRVEGIKYLSELPIEDLLAYDDQCFPVPRNVFIKFCSAPFVAMCLRVCRFSWIRRSQILLP